MRSLALPAIRLYQRHVSPYKGFCCAYRFHLGRASCSNLGYRAIRRYGLLAGWVILRQRLKRCGVAHRRHGAASHDAQRGSAPCDLPCSGACIPDCDLPDINSSRVLNYVNCCDACSCDWPSRKDKRQTEADQAVHLPPRSRPP